jgi:hypothetical protein
VAQLQSGLCIFHVSSACRAWSDTDRHESRLHHCLIFVRALCVMQREAQVHACVFMCELHHATAVTRIFRICVAEREPRHGAAVGWIGGRAKLLHICCVTICAHCTAHMCRPTPRSHGEGCMGSCSAAGEMSHLEAVVRVPSPWRSVELWRAGVVWVRVVGPEGVSNCGERAWCG